MDADTAKTAFSAASTAISLCAFYLAARTRSDTLQDKFQTLQEELALEISKNEAISVGVIVKARFLIDSLRSRPRGDLDEVGLSVDDLIEALEKLEAGANPHREYSPDTIRQLRRTRESHTMIVEMLGRERANGVLLQSMVNDVLFDEAKRLALKH